MSATLIADLPKTVCAEIKTLLPDLQECAPHWGVFDVNELKKLGVRAPAVLVALLDIKQSTTFAGAAHSFSARMVAYVITKDGLGLPRDAAAATICQALVTFVPDKTWGLSALGAAEQVSLGSLITAKSRDRGASLWAVTWHQPITFFDQSDAPLGVELYVGQSPNVGAAHVGDYEQIGEPDA